ncbi:cuticle protein 18.6-like [Procambarus clarkii]|uniref:cuticle protein 18.6 n=1 Tax=Procambarus clarkii TaxID=6728 RepID=UPI003743B94E
MKALVLLLCLPCVSWCKPTTVVSFSPVGYSPGVAPGFAYAFRAPAPLYSRSGGASGRSLSSGALSNHVDPLAYVPTVLKTQYHSQDELGQYAFGYVGDASTAHEVRTLDGAVRGSYTYVDSNGKLQTASYVADRNGFRVKASNLPQAPLAAAPVIVSLPEPVKPTPEVVAATAAHLRAVAEVKASRIKRASISHLLSSDKLAPGNRTNHVKEASTPFPVLNKATVPPSTVHSDHTKANQEDLVSVTQVSLPSSPVSPVDGAPRALPQFDSQDELAGVSRQHMVHIPGGITRGSYSYIDTNGEMQTVLYMADDEHGFRVLESNFLEDPSDTN